MKKVALRCGARGHDDRAERQPTMGVVEVPDDTTDQEIDRIATGYACEICSTAYTAELEKHELDVQTGKTDPESKPPRLRDF